MKTEIIRHETSVFSSGRYFVGDLLTLMKNNKDLQKAAFYSDDQESFDGEMVEVELYGQWHKAFFANTEVGGEAVFSVSNGNGRNFKTTTGVVGLIELKDNVALHDMCSEAVFNGFGDVITITGNFEPEALPGDVFEFGQCIVEEV